MFDDISLYIVVNKTVDKIRFRAQTVNRRNNRRRLVGRIKQQTFAKRWTIILRVILRTGHRSAEFRRFVNSFFVQFGDCNFGQRIFGQKSSLAIELTGIVRPARHCVKFIGPRSAAIVAIGLFLDVQAFERRRRSIRSIGIFQLFQNLSAVPERRISKY